MYVILTAFQGKLKSEPLLWPDNSPPEIRLFMDLDLVTQGYLSQDAAVSGQMTRPESKLGLFRKTGYGYVVGDKSAKEYALYDIRG